MRGPLSRLAPAAMLTGTIVGAGIFALPTTAARAGLLTTLIWLVALSGLMVLFHRMFAEIVMRTGAPHRLPGYVRLYLGQGAGRVAFVNAFIGGLGVLLIYLVLIEQFFGNYIPIPNGFFVSASWFVLVILIALGIKTIERTELFMSIGIITLVFALAAFMVPHIQLERLTVNSGWTDALLPFGVFLFALGGFNAIPEMRDFFIKNGRGFGRAITVGILVPTGLYAVFMAAFVGAFGADISDNLSETVSTLGGAPVALLMVLGAVAILTSFLVIGAYLVDTLRYDLNVRRHVALLILAIPLFVYLLGIRQFVPLVALIGTVFTGIDGILLLLTWRSAKKMNRATSATLTVRLPDAAFLPLVLFFAFGVMVSLVAQLL